MDPEYFGCYYDFYAQRLKYLGLLHLGDLSESKESISELIKIRESPTWEKDSLKLLKDNNWRGHLGPLVSFVATGGKSKVLEVEFWSCVKKGSWVIPQLIAGLHILGADVVSNSVQILEQGISRNISDPIIAHSETGPGSDNSRKGKLINSLVGLGFKSDLPLSNQLIDELSNLDIDNSKEISASWYKSIIEALNCV